jgi:hypothetical protein
MTVEGQRRLFSVAYRKVGLQVVSRSDRRAAWHFGSAPFTGVGVAAARGPQLRNAVAKVPFTLAQPQCRCGSSPIVMIYY